MSVVVGGDGVGIVKAVIEYDAARLIVAASIWLLELVLVLLLAVGGVGADVEVARQCTMHGARSRRAFGCASQGELLLPLHDIATLSSRGGRRPQHDRCMHVPRVHVHCNA